MRTLQGGTSNQDQLLCLGFLPAQRVNDVTSFTLSCSALVMN